MTSFRWTRSLYVLAVALCALSVQSVNASMVTASIEAVVSSIVDNRSELFNYDPYGGLQVGDTVSGSVTYDTSSVYGVLPLTGSPFGSLCSSLVFEVPAATALGTLWMRWAAGTTLSRPAGTSLNIHSTSIPVDRAAAYSLRTHEFQGTRIPTLPT
jgi:hypothetical protein